MRRCRSIDRPIGITKWQGLMIDCEISVAPGEGPYAVEITGEARIYKCVLLADTNAVYAAGAQDAEVAMLITSAITPLHANVTNLVDAAIVDANAIIISDPHVSL